MKSISITLSLVGLSLLLTGCVHYKVIPADKTIHRLKANETFTAPFAGWFVPDARWLEIREALNQKIEELETPK